MSTSGTSEVWHAASASLWCLRINAFDQRSRVKAGRGEHEQHSINACQIPDRRRHKRVTEGKHASSILIFPAVPHRLAPTAGLGRDNHIAGRISDLLHGLHKFDPTVVLPRVLVMAALENYGRSQTETSERQRFAEPLADF